MSRHRTPYRSVCRPSVYWLLIALSAATMLARVATVQSSRGDSPVLSANDRSRWSTIRALVDEGTFAIDNVIFRSDGHRDPRWHTIDMVRHRGPDGREHYYSSKPALLVTLFAVPYWVIKAASGISLAKQPFYVVRLTLLLINVVPMIGFLALLTRLVTQHARTRWGRVLTIAAAAFATPLTTFSVTLNNHAPAAMLVLAATGALLAIWRAVEPGWAVCAAAGGCAALAVACELPALSFFALAAAVVVWKSPRQAAIAFALPAALVLLAAVGTNYWAHGTWSTPYFQRRDGREVARVKRADPEPPRPGPVDPQLGAQLADQGLPLSTHATVALRPLNRGYVLWDPDGQRRYALRLDPPSLAVHEWGNWYEYDGSYWSSAKQGVDRGEPSRAVYAFHVLLGHHGIFSLTPIWLLSAAGAVIWMWRGDGAQQGLGLATGLLTVVCLVFFVALRPLEDRNYGGVSCCFRWMIWLIPLWLLCLIPALDAMARRPALRWLALGLLAVSVFSAAYNGANPWSHPWLFDYWTQLGWIKY